MMHDIGMTRLPADVLERYNRTLTESDETWREHVRIGHEMVKGDLEPAAAAIILHHHQHYDGSGFPSKRDGTTQAQVKGSGIHVFARIVGAADLFDRLRHPAHAPGADPDMHPSIPTVRALRLLREKPYCEWIDPVVRLALYAVAPPYPPGTVVTLSDGRVGAVVDWSPLDPCRPTIEILSATIRGDPTFIRVDLRKHRKLSVFEVDGQYVGDDNFYPTFEGEFDLSRVGKALTNAAFGPPPALRA
jgi:HD-GYP domain-containing protein (c-di-GMP phosphodiesterase class II)